MSNKYQFIKRLRLIYDHLLKWAYQKKATLYALKTLLSLNYTFKLKLIYFYFENTYTTNLSVLKPQVFIYNTVYQLILFSKLLSCTTRPNTDLNYEENIPQILVIVHLDVQIKCFKNRYTWLPIIVGKLWHLFYIKLTLWWTPKNLLTLEVMF